MNSNTNNPHIKSRYEQWLLNHASADMRVALREFTIALQSGAIEIPAAAEPPTMFAGGTNYCPNSDLKFSKLAIVTPGTVPGDPGDTNHECYRWYRQLQTDDLTLDAAHALKATAHSLYAANEGANNKIPIWNRVDGWITHGQDAAPLWDVAVNLYNNHVKPADRWYVRIALAAETDDIIPSDLEMFCGFWHETATGQGWIEGGNLTLTYIIPPFSIAGTQEFNYLVVARTDGGATLYSQVLNVTDAPDVLDDNNVVRISYAGAANGGFIEFKIYRETVATGVINQIAHLRNDNSLLFDDDGDNLPLPPLAAFPSGGSSVSQSLTYSTNLVVGANGSPLLINDFTINVPPEYNWSETLAFSQFLRFGFTIPSGFARHICIDRIYLGPTFNNWSDSPFDPAGAIPSTSQTGGTGTGGGGNEPPDCIRIDTPVLRLDFDAEHEWMPYELIPDGDLLENGLGEKSVVKFKPEPRGSYEYYRVEFSNDVFEYCTRPHRFRINEAGDSETALRLNVGDTVWGWMDGEEGPVTLISKILIKKSRPEKFGTFVLVGEKSHGNHYYVAGYSKNGKNGVFNRNRKQV